MNLHNFNQRPIAQQFEIASWLTKFPALTIMPFLRNDVGYRLLNPLHLFVMNGTLAFAAWFFDLSYPTANWVDLFMFACASFLLGLIQRQRRFWDYQRGKAQHSYYIGTSGWEFLPFPRFIRRHRLLARFADPLSCAAAGVFLLPVSCVLGCWLIFSSMCLHIFEETVRRKERNENMDMMDSLVASQVHTQTVEHFEQPQESPKRQPSIAVPTGIGADIRGKIRSRKWLFRFNQ